MLHGESKPEQVPHEAEKQPLDAKVKAGAMVNAVDDDDTDAATSEPTAPRDESLLIDRHSPINLEEPKQREQEDEKEQEQSVEPIKPSTAHP